jgi:uncharacterized protein YndB with AHSA1/START domain
VRQRGEEGDVSTTVKWRMHLRSGPDAVFRMLATDEGRARFWAESAVESGGVVEFRFVNGTVTRGRIVRSEPPHRIEFEYFGSRAVFELAPDGRGGTDLTLTNTGYDPADHEDVLPGWLNVLFPLKAAVDFGVDLRNHDPARSWDDGFADQ